MAIFTRIRNFMFNFFIRAQSPAKKERNPVALSKAKKIGILFHGENIRANDVILEFAHQLKLSLKEVQLLGYIPKREFGFVYPFPFITNKDTTWYGKPGGKNSGYFMHSPFDLIINFCHEDCLPLDYISAISASKFRVGFNPDADIAKYDLILIPKENGDISSQIRNLEKYLN